MMVVSAASDSASASAAVPTVQIVVDKSVLHCSLCTLPLKPPVFQCLAKHAACGQCAANHANKCPVCECGGGDGVYECDESAGRFLLAARVPCPNQAYGCGRSVVYCMVADHRLVCPHAPCRCPEPLCGFLGPPPALRVHLTERHKWPVTNIAYGSVLEVQTHPAARGPWLLAAEDGQRLFLLVMSERGLKVVRVTAAAEASSYRYKVWKHARVDTDTGDMDVLMLDAKVESCAVPSEEEAMGVGGTYLPLPSDVPAPEAEGVIVYCFTINKQV